MTCDVLVVTEADLPAMRRLLEVGRAVFDEDDGAHRLAVELLALLDRKGDR